MAPASLPIARANLQMKAAFRVGGAEHNTVSDPVDLFGQPTGPAQFSLFGAGEDRLQAPRMSLTPEPDTIRARLNALLTRAREASALPWSDRDARMWQTVFPQMANWLPEPEADQLRLAFSREVERLLAL